MKNTSRGSKAGGAASASGPAKPEWTPPSLLSDPFASAPLEPQLTKAEQKELQELELVIQKGWGTFLEVGKALITINDKRLYRDAFATFDEYSRAKGLSPSYAYNLMGSAEVHEQISSIEEIQPKPATESQCRELLPVPKENRVKAWMDAVKLAGDEPMTAKIVREAAAKHKPGSNGKPKPPKSTPAKRGDLGTALKLLAKAEKAASDSKDSAVLKALKALRKCLEALAEG